MNRCNSPPSSKPYVVKTSQVVGRRRVLVRHSYSMSQVLSPMARRHSLASFGVPPCSTMYSAVHRRLVNRKTLPLSFSTHQVILPTPQTSAEKYHMVNLECQRCCGGEILPLFAWWRLSDTYDNAHSVGEKKIKLSKDDGKEILSTATVMWRWKDHRLVLAGPSLISLMVATLSTLLKSSNLPDCTVDASATDRRPAVR